MPPTNSSRSLSLRPNYGCSCLELNDLIEDLISEIAPDRLDNVLSGVCAEDFSTDTLLMILRKTKNLALDSRPALVKDIKLVLKKRASLHEMVGLE